ncbi:hypothetical protein NPV37_003131 [Salmonella enterica]|nr:hypothetical protein [Salmonella enterica subsp. enterica serovar Typhimurium]EDW0490170.1 hypothetical protein [Salmonella enterica subsp. enterica serovar Inverness]EGK4889721.1 hypothetical protein [Salmonella enterica]EKR1870060.1 hypothetical protein [Salmonella enterica subsp. diarizonae serovar 11:k:z53]EKV8807974.1 hypothetical protein [Klebsiella aerogenes]
MNKKLLFWVVTIGTFLFAIVVAIIALNTEAPLADRLMKMLQMISFCLGGYGVFIAAYSNIYQSEINNIKAGKMHQYQIDKESFGLVRAWDSERLLKARDFSRSLREQSHSLSANELVATIKSDPERESSVVMLLNFCDNIRLGLEKGLLNEHIIVTLAPAMLDILERFKPYVVAHDKNNAYQKDHDALISRLKSIT